MYSNTATERAYDASKRAGARQLSIGQSLTVMLSMSLGLWAAIWAAVAASTSTGLR